MERWASGSATLVGILLLPNERGNATTMPLVAGGPAVSGFTYVIAVFPREGIKAINGKPLAKE